MKSRLVYILVTAILFILCCIIVMFFGKYVFIRGFLGDVIVIALIFSFIKSLILKLDSLKLCIGVLIFAYTIEVMQYFNLVDLLGLDNYKIARIVIGSSFDYWDLLAYTCGFACTVLIERKILNYFNNGMRYSKADLTVKDFKK